MAYGYMGEEIPIYGYGTFPDCIPGRAVPYCIGPNEEKVKGQYVTTGLLGALPRLVCPAGYRGICEAASYEVPDGNALRLARESCMMLTRVYPPRPMSEECKRLLQVGTCACVAGKPCPCDKPITKPADNKDQIGRPPRGGPGSGRMPRQGGDKTILFIALAGIAYLVMKGK